MIIALSLPKTHVNFITILSDIGIRKNASSTFLHIRKNTKFSFIKPFFTSNPVF